MGLMLCVVAGADLFTSNCMYSAVAVWEGEQPHKHSMTCSAVLALCKHLR